MNSLEENCIHSLNDLWHNILSLSSQIALKERFTNLKTLTTLDVGIINLVAQDSQIIFREICEKLDIPKSTLTSVIDRLEKGNYLKRVISSRDRRSYGLELTEQGKVVQQEHIDFEYILCSEIVKTLDSADERELFLKMVKKISCKLNESKRNNLK